MDQRVLDFFRKERICVLATVSKDRIPQTAVLHYSHKENPLTFFFSAERTNRKYKNMLQNNKASCAVGWSEEEWITIQMDETVKELKGIELEDAKKIHYAKHPDSQKWEHDPNTVFLAFTPNWIRISDYSKEPADIKVVMP